MFRRRTPAPANIPAGPSRPETTSQEAFQRTFTEARGILGEALADAILPLDTPATAIQREYFQSKTFQKAELRALPDRYGDHDRQLTTVILANGAEVYIISGKVSTGNPYEVVHASLMGGVDARPTNVTVYAYDGAESITEYGPDGTANVYTGENGSPEVLLPYIYSAIGTPVGDEVFRPA